jgi:type IV pilus assembly protein PilV
MAASSTLQTQSRRVRGQRGFMLIEALIAILIFSIGILGVIGLQASAVMQSTDARNRAEAAYLAEQLLGQMWVGQRDVATLTSRYSDCGSSCAGYYAWYNNVKAVLPGVDETTDTKPRVTIAPDGTVIISIFWRSPNDDASSDPHHYDLQAQIVQQ